MAIYFDTDKPQTLLNKFVARIDQEEVKGKITTWMQHKDGAHFTHTSKDWRDKAFLKPKVEKERLVFNIIKPESVDVTWIVYAYYHGHLIETFVSHFHDDFIEGIATAMPTTGDYCAHK
jgi:hypothetical protein